jgi:hypothetical protein
MGAQSNLQGNAGQQQYAHGKTPPQGNAGQPMRQGGDSINQSMPTGQSKSGQGAAPGNDSFSGPVNQMQYNPGRQSNPNPQPGQGAGMTQGPSSLGGANGGNPYPPQGQQHGPPPLPPQQPPSGGGYQGGPGGFQNAMNAQFGSNNPFSPNASYNTMGQNYLQAGGNQASQAGGSLGNVANTSMNNQWYGDSPIATAQAAAQQQLDKNLSGLRSRYGAAGGGNSARAGIAEGTAVGEMGTQLGAQLAQLGVGARQGDIQNATNAYSQQGQLGLGVGGLGAQSGNLYNNQQNTALNALLGAGQLGNQNTANQLTAAGQMGNMGNNLTGIGAGEQAPANQNAIMSLLGMFSGGNTTGSGSTHGNQASGFLGK